MTPISILTAVQMRAAEQAVFDAGMDEYALMERAGAAAAEIIWRVGGRQDALILCGPGNNGGDGYVIARLLKARGVAVRVAALGDSMTPSARTARAGWDGPVEPLVDAAPATQLVDALFGTGLSRGLDPAIAARLCALVDDASHSYAIDLPSGVDTDSGALLSAVPVFDICIALGAWKPAHLLHPAAGRIKRLHYADIGITASDTIHRLPPPRLHVPVMDAHKYSRGMVAVVGGAMPGAALLASVAAARSGAGMVRLLAAKAGEAASVHAIVHQHADTPATLVDMLSDPRMAAVLIGPGLGRGEAARARLDAAMNAGDAMVLDADALTLLGDRGDIPAN
ncbi:MAG: NAD(P)H-hydrate epimerase, partial [Sphingomonadaceae bacterium]|nr:NAD(P)H-hydrate epimerase [Sphingomonadaceae bacterium]